MAAPTAPTVVLNPYYPSDGTVSFNIITFPDVDGMDIDIYDSGGTLVYTGAATGLNYGYTMTWTLDVPVTYFGTAGNTYDVSVHVFNDDGDAYAYTSLTVYDRPQVTLVPAQGTTITDLPLTVLWSVTDPTGVSAQVLRVSGAHETIYATDYKPSMALDPTERSAVIGPENMLNPLVDGETYTVELKVVNGVGFITIVTHTITTSWQPPVTPTATVSTDPDTLAASVTVTAGAGTPATDTLMVVRVNPDGTRYVLADDLESGDSVTDPLPPLGVAYTYEVTGIAATGVPSTAEIVPVTIKTGAWALNFGNNAEECVLFRYNPSASYSIEHGGEMYHFADGGADGGYPVWYGTTDRDESGSLSWQTANRSLADKLHDLSLKYPTGWIRDPYGHSWYAYIRPSMSHDRTRVCKVSIDWDKMRWREP